MEPRSLAARRGRRHLNETEPSLAMNAHSHAQPAPAPEESARLALTYRAGMRKLAGAASILTVGEGESRNGLTTTSVSSLSVEPPTLVVCVNKAASARAELTRRGCFAINVLRPHHRFLAEQFAGKDGMKGAARYAGARWTRLETGAPVLEDALAAFDCELEEAIERHSHVILLGRVVRARIAETGAPLAYWDGDYRTLAV
ncbi:flavin reductase family protein [Roseixanthobacter liquoris]|uniref:flavin reductase family protein n=1 Tax=Roseixanthobacter liquoris TaxID=3119921 RepID=UPI00372BDB5F